MPNRIQNKAKGKEFSKLSNKMMETSHAKTIELQNLQRNETFWKSESFFFWSDCITQFSIYVLLPTLLEDFLIDSTYLKSKCIPLNCISSVFKITVVAEIRCPRQSKDFRYSTEDMLSPMQKSTTQLLTFLDRPK